DSAQNSNYYDCKITNTNEERIALKWQAFFTSDHSLYLRFEEREAQRYLINIFDISGKSLCYQIISKSESSIQLPTLPVGIYFVSVSSSFGIFSKKLIQAY
ncbi:MAG: T9SS type A sorting domain-containing protein, partial [Saprospiraceae bacterium]